MAGAAIWLKLTAFRVQVRTKINSTCYGACSTWSVLCFLHQGSIQTTAVYPGEILASYSLMSLLMTAKTALVMFCICDLHSCNSFFRNWPCNAYVLTTLQLFQGIRKSLGCAQCLQINHTLHHYGNAVQNKSCRQAQSHQGRRYFCKVHC